MGATRPRRVGLRARRNRRLLWRHWLAGKLIMLGIWVMPRCRYRTELLIAMWTLNLKVQAHCAATAVREASLDKQHRVP